jgi:chromosome segregation ATPase
MLDTIHYHTDVHHHYGASGLAQEQFLIIQNQFTKMSEELLAIKASLEEAKAKVAKVSADVDSLHTKIDSITGEVPTADEWNEVKTLAADLNSSLQVVDDKTADATSE